MESTRRDLHSTTSTLSSLLTKFAKLAAQASTDYSSSGVLKEDLGRQREELEGEIQGSLETVSFFFIRSCRVEMEHEEVTLY